MNALIREKRMLKQWLKAGYIAIFRALWRWARRRHRNKSAGWIRHKYFGPDWQFYGKVPDKDGNRRRVTLFRAAQVPIQRHVKVRNGLIGGYLWWRTRSLPLLLLLHLFAYPRFGI